jgi:hypothetical protein
LIRIGGVTDATYGTVELSSDDATEARLTAALAIAKGQFPTQ